MNCWRLYLQIFITYLLLQNSLSTVNTPPLVTLSQGKIQGTEYISREGNKYNAYLGIPYASVPERFEPPQPPPSWTGIRDATQFGSVCPQLVRATNAVIGEEECLFLNVFTPQLKGNFPVIIYIHGGALMTGSGDLYGGSYFVDQRILLVTFNYRLGALGFLSTSDETIQGNAGLKDQVMAMSWVKANIAQFGGDPSRITIMGESAGSASVAYHLLSPMSRGLFQSAISQSGTALDPEHFEPDPLPLAIDLAVSLDCPQFPTVELADCLRQTSFRKIVQIKLTKWHLDPLVQYPPTKETLRPGQSESDVFLTEEPIVLLQEGRVNRVPWVVGMAEEEGLLFHSAYISRNQELQRNMNEDWNYVAPITLYYDKQYISGEERNQISRTIRGFYFGDRKVEASSSKNLTNMYSDRLINWGVRTSALLQAKFSPVYIYIFGYLGENSMLQLFYGDSFKGPTATTHGDDLQYFFNSTRYYNLKKDSKDEQVSVALVKLWSAFAATGNMMASLETLKVAWLPVSVEEIRRRRLKWCYIDEQSKILAREPFTERMEFWDKMFDQLNKIFHKHVANSTTTTITSETSNTRDQTEL